MEHSYLFDDPKNDIYFLKQNIIKHKHKDFIFVCFLVQIYLLGSGTLRR